LRIKGWWFASNDEWRNKNPYKKNLRNQNKGCNISTITVTILLILFSILVSAVEDEDRTDVVEYDEDESEEAVNEDEEEDDDENEANCSNEVVDFVNNDDHDEEDNNDDNFVDSDDNDDDDEFDIVIGNDGKEIAKVANISDSMRHEWKVSLRSDGIPIPKECTYTSQTPIFKILSKGRRRDWLREESMKDPFRMAYAIKLGVTYYGRCDFLFSNVYHLGF
jgi:hypothetical protein